MALADDIQEFTTQWQALQTSRERLKARQARFKELLARICSAVRADAAYPNVDPDALRRADELLSSMVWEAYGEKWGFKFLPPFSHTYGTLVKDSERTNLAATSNPIISIIRAMEGLAGPAPSVEDIVGDNSYHLHKFMTHDKLPKPHENSSPISRFRPGGSEIAKRITDATPLAQAVYQARFSAYDISTPTPLSMVLPPNSSCLAIIGAGGWKNRDPMLTYYLLDEEGDWAAFCKMDGVEVGLSQVAQEAAVDPERKLLWVGDGHRVKSYQYGTNSKSVGKHTLRTKNTGPLMLLDKGSKILRAGTSGIDSWNVDELPDHGPKGTKRIGEGKFNIEHSMRDEPEEIERSTGVAAHTSTPLAQGAVEPRTWTRLPSGQVLVSSKKKFSVWLTDLETGLKPVTRFVGHGAFVNEFSISEQDPNSFLTACNDGIARLYDVREPLPRLSFDNGMSSEPLYSALYVHVDGLPVVFTGGQKSESIKVWDVRQKSILYELATGNNSVLNLAWDAPRSTLLACTESQYMDWMGGLHGYRPAYLPRTEYNRKNIGEERWNQQAERERKKARDVDSDDEDDFDGRHWWPDRAFHDESAFAYSFDSGGHSLFAYKFGLDADPKILPDYGRAYPQDDDYF
ncbi:hypothetical protein EIP91_005600 [Steccherinum ochraceum]|uniref:Uncharacterized protein n=1 Tax=Steccherinum ochraceum TaxID=92696 RepID=A0A4R0R7C2_9APHY|nr:hypothetical protein EIP91_005600 [Steccherinum ochraceum]